MKNLFGGQNLKCQPRNAHCNSVFRGSGLHSGSVFLWSELPFGPFSFITECWISIKTDMWCVIYWSGSAKQKEFHRNSFHKWLLPRWNNERTACVCFLNFWFCAKIKFSGASMFLRWPQNPIRTKEEKHFSLSPFWIHFCLQSMFVWEWCKEPWGLFLMDAQKMESFCPTGTVINLRHRCAHKRSACHDFTSCLIFCFQTRRSWCRVRWRRSADRVKRSPWAWTPADPVFRPSSSDETSFR